MRHALITGGLGFIGSHIARYLIANEHVDEVVLLDHYGGYVSPTRSGFVDYRQLRIKGIESKIKIERGQAQYATVMSKMLAEYRPAYIFHLAALPLASIQNLTTQEATEGSVVSTSNILEICASMKRSDGYAPDRFVYASSSMVYGDFKYEPADEDHDTEPNDIYGTMKLAGEVITRGLGRLYGIDTTIIRPSAVYGPTDMNRRVSQIFVEKALAGEKRTIMGEDEALDFTHVTDTAQGFALAALSEQGIGETFNITSGNAHTLIELAHAIKDYVPDLQYEVVERDGGRPKRGTLSISKARDLLGFEPKFDLATGVADYIDFVRAHGSSENNA